MTLTKKLEQHMKWFEKRGTVISKESSTRILQSYYRSLGISQDTSFTDWMYGVSKGKYPAYGSVTRAIRKARELHPEWRKYRQQVDKEIKNVKKEVGYGKPN